MEFHISRAFRENFDVADLLFSYTGNVVFGNVAASRRLAKQMNEARGSGADPTLAVSGAALFAMGLIDEMNHALIAYFRAQIDPNVLADAVRWFSEKISPAHLQQLLLTFTQQFPNVAVYNGELTAAKWLQLQTADLPHRQAALEELLLLWIANSNPAFASFRELFADTGLQEQKAYQSVTASFPEYFKARPALNASVGSLLDALRAPILASPESITGQLEFIREHWAPYLGESVRRALLAIDTLREEDLAIWMRFHPPGPDHHRHGAPGRNTHGFTGDEYVGFEDEFGDEFELGPDGQRRRRYSSDYQAPLNEYEAFSADQAWMPNVVLMAKSTYVWLEQLSQKYGRHIHRLDQIPDEELQLLKTRGITGLWLIGLWERSVASQTIKRLRGAYDAVASAYSLKEYEIAQDLGGNSAYENLRDRAARFGLRLASDMVPNHMGIDSNWVIEHPDWFLHRWESPFPVYTFNGPDLSSDSRVEIKIEDHYYDQTDAAVIFRLRHHAHGATRYVYHGNDGTTFAWNDTAQLDYSKAAVREHVIQVILHVARLFPIIRFDAAMVLAKRHVQRLWFPLPGAGGSIPSRAENAMSQEEFEALMPYEFWREVVDRVSAEVPGTLLLAEAFWLLEGYFVRTLGMHRVYNSAFMNMMRDEENAKYRSYLKKTIEFDADILKRYVNFMSNPDERTAIDQFGSGDKYFGTCTLLATLPGLPMFGHGQIEGFTERYGMEYKQAKMREWPNDDLIARHQHEIAPLLANRRIFAESQNFTLYDFWTAHGSVDENVFAYSNRLGDERSVVIYNNVYGSTNGTLHTSVGFTDKGSGGHRQRTLAEGLALPHDNSLFIAYRDTATGLEYLRRVSDLRHHGLTLPLRGYQYAVLLHWRELRASAEHPWDQLHDSLRGTGVYNLDETLTRLRLRPLHEALHSVLSSSNIASLATLVRECAKPPSVARKPAATASEAVAKNTSAKLAPAQDETSSDKLLNDSRLKTFLARAAQVQQAIQNLLPGDDAAQPVSQTASAELARSVQAAESVSTGVTARAKRTRAPTSPASAPAAPPNLSTLAHAALQLIESSTKLLKQFPAAAEVIPSAAAAEPWTHVWAPLLAWILIDSSLPCAARVAHFDNLQLRAGLAEVFSSLGLEGERAWQAAAEVRTLLSFRDPLPATHIPAFWADPDVRWLAGVNESEGTLYLNRELTAKLLWWVRLPALLTATQTSSFTRQTKSLTDTAAADLRALESAGYKLDTFLRELMPANETSSDKHLPA